MLREEKFTCHLESCCISSCTWKQIIVALILIGIFWTHAVTFKGHLLASKETVWFSIFC